MKKTCKHLYLLAQFLERIWHQTPCLPRLCMIFGAHVFRFCADYHVITMIIAVKSAGGHLAIDSAAWQSSFN